MPEQAFGGDDDSGQQPQQQPAKKLDLKKYASQPDLNIRDLFWKIIENYANKKTFSKEELELLTHERMALLRIILSILKNQKNAYLPLSVKSAVMYSITLFLDAKWQDVFEEFMVKSYGENNKPAQQVLIAFENIYKKDSYKEQIIEYFRKMIRNRDMIEAVLAYLAKVKIKDLLENLKKELLIIARSDIEKNQHYAMYALAKMMENNDVKSVLNSLIIHWDSETRRVAVDILKNENDTALIEIAKRQNAIENDPQIKKALEKIIKKEQVKQNNNQTNAVDDS